MLSNAHLPIKSLSILVSSLQW